MTSQFTCGIARNPNDMEKIYKSCKYLYSEYIQVLYQQKGTQFLKLHFLASSKCNSFSLRGHAVSKVSTDSFIVSMKSLALIVAH